jgi:hypothetical protein
MSDKEREDGILFNSIHTLDIRKQYLSWVMLIVNRSSYIPFEIPVTVPEVCSDGVVRSPEEYVLFTSGKTLDEHIQEIRNFNTMPYSIILKIVYNGTVYQGMFMIAGNR